LATTTGHQDTFLEIFIYLWKRPEALLLMLGFGSACIVSYSFFTWIPTFFYEKFHLSLTAAGFSAVLYLQLASIAGALIFGKITDRLSSHLHGGGVIMQIIGLLLGIFFIIMIGKANTLSGVIIALLGFGFAKGGYEGGIFPALYETISVNKRVIASGVKPYWRSHRRCRTYHHGSDDELWQNRLFHEPHEQCLFLERHFLWPSNIISYRIVFAESKKIKI
ncbi:MAG: MFS transporter, partial [Verrucomicrobiota bacterium]